MSREAEPEVSEVTRVPAPGGAVVLRGRILARWRAAATEMTPDGDDVQAHLEHPLGEQAAVPEGHGGGAFQLFKRGMIVERADGRAFVVYGAIYDHYLAMGGTQSPIGQPTSEEESDPRGGRVAHFDGGDIYWREEFGARDVRGARRAEYATRSDPFKRSLVARALSRGKALLLRPRTRPTG